LRARAPLQAGSRNGACAHKKRGDRRFQDYATVALWLAKNAVCRHPVMRMPLSTLRRSFSAAIGPRVRSLWILKVHTMVRTPAAPLRAGL
jgi:hypothetical protein